MKRHIFTMAIAAMMIFAACQKEDQLEPINPEVNDTTPEEEMASIFGTWTPTANSYSKILFYRQDNGELLDSVVNQVDDATFVFGQDSLCTSNPWDATLNYSMDGNKLSFSIYGYNFRTYNIKTLTQTKLVMMYSDTSTYSTSDEDGNDIYCDGVEIEYWELMR